MEKTHIKALFFDIDGTLVGLKSHRLNERDVQSLRKLKESGYLLFIATGRDSAIPEEFEPVKPLLPYLTGVIDVNGQHCALTDGTLIASHPIDDDDFLALRAGCAEHHISMLYRHGHTNYITELNDHARKAWEWLGGKIPEVRPLDPDVHNVPKICIHCSPEEEAEYLTPLMKHTWTARIMPDLIDLIPEGIGKDSGIRDMCAYFGIGIEETMGFGDGQNDLCMLNTVGIAVAMENADDEVKAAADHVTRETENAGISLALEHFGLLPSGS